MVKAIDCMYYVATRAFMEAWDKAKAGELECRMEKAIEHQLGFGARGLPGRSGLCRRQGRGGGVFRFSSRGTARRRPGD